MKSVKKELESVRKCFDVIEGHMSRLIRVAHEQENICDLLGRELNRQAKVVARLREKLSMEGE